MAFLEQEQYRSKKVDCLPIEDQHQNRKWRFIGVKRYLLLQKSDDPL
jgi:hypothetical protein